MELPKKEAPEEDKGKATATEWGRRATLHVGTFNHKPPATNPSGRRRFSEDVLQNSSRQRPISGIAARCRAWTMRFHRNSTAQRDGDINKWKTSPYASSLAINMSLLVGTADVLSDIAERAFFTALQTNDVEEVSLALDRFCHVLPQSEDPDHSVPSPSSSLGEVGGTIRRDSIQTEILLRNCEHLLGKYEKGGAELLKSEAETAPFHQNALHTAVYYESGDVVELLLSRGFDPNVVGEIRPERKYSDGRESVLRFIVPPSLSGCDLKKAEVDDFWLKRPVIFLAAQVGNHGILKTLLKYGASVNVTDDNGDCPLHFIVHNLMQNVRCVSLLIEQGISLYHCNKEGKTPLDINPELKHLYKRIVLDHLEPLSPDNSSKPSEEVIFKRRLRSIGGTSDQMKQSFGALTLSKLRLRKMGARAEIKACQKEEYDVERQEHKRKSVGRRMSFAFRNLFDKKKRYHFDDINDPDVGRNFESASSRSHGETSRVIERRRCVSFNDTVEKYPHDSEKSILTLSYMVGDRDCAMMVARRLPRCWPRILTLATTLGPDVCRNTVLILSGVSNMILNRDSPDKRKCKTLEQPVAVLKLAVGILSTIKSKATTILRNVVCNMIEFITEEIGRTDSTHKKIRRKVEGSAQWTAVAKTHSHIKRQMKNQCNTSERCRDRNSLKDLQCYGQKQAHRRPFCKKCGICLSEIHRLRNFNVRNRQKRKCRADSISRRKTISNFRTVLGFELLMDCLIGLQMCRTLPYYPSTGKDMTQLSVEANYYIPNDKNHGDYPQKPSGMTKSFRNIVAIKESPTEEDYEHLCSHGLVGQSSRLKGLALSQRVQSSDHEYNGKVARLQTKVSNILRALFSDKRHVTTPILQSCFSKLLSRAKSSSEELEENLRLNILCILEVVFLHPPNAVAFHNLDLSGSLLEFLEGRDENSPSSQGLVIELQVFRLLIFTANVSEAVSISQSPGLQHVFIEKQEDGAHENWKRKKDMPESMDRIVSLCDFLHILLGLDKHFLSPRGLSRPPWSNFLEVLPFVVHTAILLNGIQAYLRMCYQMVLKKANSVDVAQTAGIEETFQFLEYWLQDYPQDFVRDSVAEKSCLSLLSLFSDLKLKHHPTVILLQSTVGQIKSTILFQNLTKKVLSSKRPVNRTSSLPPQLQERSSPGRLTSREKSSGHGSNRSLDGSSSPYSRRSKNLWNLLLLRNYHVSQSVNDVESLERSYCECQKKVSHGDLSCGPEVAAKLASLQIQLEDLNNSCKLPTIGWLQETDLTLEENIDNKSMNGFFSRWSLRKKGRNSDPNIFGSNQESCKSRALPHAFSTVPRSFRTLSARVLYPREGRSKIMSCSEDISEDPLPELSIDHCLPPDLAKHPHVQQLLRMHLKEYVSNSWEGRESARVDYLKAKYVSICEEVEASQQVTFPVKYVSRSGRKRTYLLHISNTHITLLQADSKSPVERHPLGLVEDWHVTFEKESGGYPTLVVTFSDHVGCCWRLVVNTPQQVKHICTTLSSVMEEVQNNNNDGSVATTPGDTPSKDTTSTKGRRQRFSAFREKSISVQSSGPPSLPEDKELLLCIHYLQFPVEAASILTNTEFELFQEVKSSSYVNYIRNGGLKLTEAEQQTDKKTIHDLKDRCEKVTKWVVETILDLPTEHQFPLMQQFVELANTCWNMGNFQGVVEILEALLSDRLQDVLSEADSANVSSLMHLHQAIIEGEADYQDALDKSLRIPGCKVVPYFGVFLDQLVAVWEEPSPALSMSMLEMEREITQWDWWARDGDMPTASPGLLSTEKMSQAYWILEDLRFCQRLAKQNATLEEFSCTDSPTVTSGTYENEDLAYHSCSEDFDDAESIEPLPKTHGLEIVPQQCMDANLSALHCMLRGCRVFRVDEEGSKYSECFLRLDESNAVLIWTKVQQKYLPNGSLSASLSILSSKYSTSNYIVGGLEEGFLDLTYAKELLSEADELDCTHISHSTDYELFPFAILYGTSIIENKLLYFLAPKNTCALWKAGLGPIIRAIQMQQRAVSDKRSKWLMKQFLNAFFFKGILGGPTALEAVQMFGGRHPTLSKMKDKEQINDEEGPTVFQPKAKLSMKKRVEVPEHKSQKTDTSSAGPTLAGSKPKKKMKKLKGLKKLKKKKGKKKEDGLQPDAEVAMDTPDEESDDSDEGDEEEESDGGSDVGELDREEYLQDSSGVESVELTNGDITKKEEEVTKERIPKNLSFYSRLTFPEFAQLFQSFTIRTRKDIKDIFEPFSYKLPNTPPEKVDIPSTTPDLEKSGVPHITRNILPQTVQSEVSKVLDFLATSSITNNSTGPPQTMNVQVMGAEELQGFILEEQGEELSIPQVESLIRRHEPNAELRSQVLLSFEGFARLLMDKENFIFNHEEASNKPLTSPLSHYYIKSSHNTYLTGHQLRGESSVELYAQVLLTGCRCVELDCWDGDDGWPIIYHGHTLTTKISFKDVVEAINKAAFVTSKYPVILSIENHCSIQQQTKMATIFKEVLGEKLVSNFLFESDFEEDCYLPSPEQLKEKVIIKNKKIKPSSNEEPKQKTSKTSQYQNREMSEDEEEDEMFEDAYDELSSAEDNTSLSVETKKTVLNSENSLEESIQHSEKSAIGKGKHKRNASGSQSLLALAAAAEEVQKKKKKKEPVISPELSELINYCQSVKFPGFGEPEDDESDAKPVKGKKSKKAEAEEEDEEDGGKMSKSKKTKKGDADEDSDGKSKKKKKEKKEEKKKMTDVEEGTGEIEENDSDSKSKKKTKDKDKKKKSKKEDKKKEEAVEGGADLLADGELGEEEDLDGKSKKKKKEKEKKKSKKDKEKNEDGGQDGDLGETGEVAEDGDSDSKSKKKSKKEKEKKKKKKDAEDKEDADEKKRKKKEAKEKKKKEKEEKKKKKGSVEATEEVAGESKEEAEVGDEEGPAEELSPIENGHGDENEDEGSDSEDQEDEDGEGGEKEDEKEEEDAKESAGKDIGDEERGEDIPKEEDVDNEPNGEVEEDEEEDSEHLTTERGKDGEETEDDVTTSITNGTKDEDLEGEDISEDVTVEKDEEKNLDENVVMEKEEEIDKVGEEEKEGIPKEDVEKVEMEKIEEVEDEEEEEEKEEEKEEGEKDEEKRDEVEKENEGEEGNDIERENGAVQDEETADNTESEKTADMDTSEGVVMTKKERKEAKKMEKVARKMEKENKKAEVQKDTLNRSKKWKKAGKVIGITSYVSGDLKENGSGDSDPPPPELRIRQLKSRTKSCHISSLNESSLKKMFRKFGSKFVQHCEFQLIRTYPAGMRIDSSNYNPILYWACGIQLVALNYQKEDLPMHIQTAFFEQNGSCGYVLKPEFMTNKSLPLFTKYNPFNKTFPGLSVKELTIEVVSGQYLNPSNPTSSCYIELEVIGIPCDSNKYKTKPVSKNMINPIWNEEFSFRIAFEELAFLRLAVIDNSSSNVVAQRILPVRCLRRGYRHVRLRSPQNVPLELSTLFVLNRLTEVQEDELQNSIQKKELLTDLVYYYVGKELAENYRQSLAEGSCVGVYGIESPDEETLLWTTGDTKVGELLAEAIGRAGKPLEDLENYVMEEEAVLNFRQGEEVQTEERPLEAEENVYEVQAAWNGKGRFVLKPAENVASTTISPVGTFLVSVHTRGVSSSMDNMSFEISVNATTPDIIARVLAKAGRLDVDPEQYVLYEEKSKDGKNLNLESSKKTLEKLVQRAVGDDEKIWDVQNLWITGGINGRFSVRDKFEEKSTSNSKLRRVTSLRQRKQKIMQSAAVQAKKVAASTESQEGAKGDTIAKKVSKLKIWKSS